MVKQQKIVIGHPEAKPFRVIKIKNEVEQVPHEFPKVLPPHWRPVVRAGVQAEYESMRGMFVMCSATRELDGKAWVHVSFSYRDHLPSYEDMIEVKELFIGREKTALQVFPPRSRHVNCHPYCLHLFHCLDGDVTPDFTRENGIL